MQFLASLIDVGLNCNFGLEEILQGFLLLRGEILATTQGKLSVKWGINNIGRCLLRILKTFNFENETINPSKVGVVSEFVKELMELGCIV